MKKTCPEDSGRSFYVQEEQMESFCSDQIRELAQALIKVQEQLQPATKDANNPFTKSKYATLNSIMDSCRDALLSNGIWLCQYPVPTEPGYLGLVTKLTHAESGQWQSSLAVVPLPKADPQGVGISMTYIRRYALSAMLGIVTEEDTDGEFTLDKLNRPQKQKNAVNASQRGKTTLDDSGQAKKIFPPLKSNARRTFQIASSGWSFIRNRIGTGWSGVHPRHRKHGGEKGTAFGGWVSLESATKNLVEVCGIVERAVLDGAALSVSAISTGEVDGRNNQKYGSGRGARNSLLWPGTGCGTANGKLAWGPLPVCWVIGYRQDAGLPTGDTGCQTLPA